MMCLFSVSDLILQLLCKIVRNMIYILGYINFIYTYCSCAILFFTQSTHVHDWRWFSQIWGMCTEKFRGSARRELNRSPIYSTLGARPVKIGGQIQIITLLLMGPLFTFTIFTGFPVFFVCMAQHIDIVTIGTVYTYRCSQKEQLKSKPSLSIQSIYFHCIDAVIVIAVQCSTTTLFCVE